MKYVYALIIVSVLITGCTAPQSSETNTAEKIVIDYYTALNNKDYKTMYGLISEGFKQLEPTAKTFETFSAYISKFFDTAQGIRVTKTTVSSADEQKIVVDYVAEITLLNDNKKDLKSSFTVKKKQEGWRLIHPYGQNIDNS